MFKFWVGQRLSVLRKAHDQMLGRDENRLKIIIIITTFAFVIECQGEKN